MTNYIPTINNEIQVLTTGLFGVESGTTSMDTIKNSVIANGIDNTANSYYELAYRNNTPSQVAALIVQNVGITGSLVPAAVSFVISNLNSALPNQQGQVIFHILKNFLGITSDPIWGAAATKYLDIVITASSYTGVLDAPNGFLLPNVIGLDPTGSAQIAALQAAAVVQATLLSTQATQLAADQTAASTAATQIAALKAAAVVQATLLSTQTTQLAADQTTASTAATQIAALQAAAVVQATLLSTQTTQLAADQTAASTAAAQIAALKAAAVVQATFLSTQTTQLAADQTAASTAAAQIAALKAAAVVQTNLVATQTTQLAVDQTAALIAAAQIAALQASLNSIVANGATTTVVGSGTTLISDLNSSDSSINILNNNPGSVFSGISTLNDNSLTSLTFSGVGLTGISSSLLDTQGVLTISNVNTNPLGVIINNVSAPNLSNLYIAGTGNTTVTTLNDSAVAIAITNTGSGTFSISNFNAPRATTQTFTNSGSGKMVIGNISHLDTDLLTLTFLGNVSDSVTSSALSSVIGSTNHSDVNINLTHTTAISANIHLGNGNNTIKDFGTTTVTDSFFLGSGNNLIDANSMTTGNITATMGDGNNNILANGLTTGNLTVSAGNGNQNITANAMTTGNMTITLGNGNNNISSNTLTTGNLTVVAGSGSNSISATAMTSGILKASLGNGLNNLILSSGGQTGVDVITHTAPNGGNTNALFSITNWYNAGIADTLKFAVAGVSNSVTNGGSVASIYAGIANANLSSGLNIFNTGGNTYFYEYTGNPLTSDLICIVGSITATATISSQTITGNHS